MQGYLPRGFSYFLSKSYEKSGKRVVSTEIDIWLNFLLHMVHKRKVRKKIWDQNQIIPTQDKNRPKADFCPSGFINFGQQKTCASLRIFFTNEGQKSAEGWFLSKKVYKGLDHSGASSNSSGAFLGSQWVRQLKFSAYASFWFREASQNLSLFRQLFFS